MTKLLAVMLRRLTTAITAPFRIFMMKGRRLFNFNMLSAKLVRPLTKHIRSLFKLKPSKRSDYFIFGRFMVYKKLVALIVLAVCAAVFIYFQIFAAPVHAAAPPSVEEIHIEEYFMFNDPDLRDFTGLAFVKSFYGYIVYAGEIERGVASGEGFLYKPEWGGLLLYEGEFENNKYNGSGILYFRNGLIQYRGEFRDNLFHGEGELFAENGRLIYIGQFVEGLFEGRGRLFNNDSLLYEGDFVAGLPHGRGTWFRPNGFIRYTGEFHEGVPHGVGTLYDEDGREIYTGSMFRGRINFRSMLGSSLEEIDELFADAPILFYSEESYASFFFERAGVLITTTSFVQVYEWEREWDFFFVGYSDIEVPGDRPNGDRGLPDFVNQERRLYFEIDRGVWQSEERLDRSRIFVRRITVLGAIHPDTDTLMLPMGYIHPNKDEASITLLPTVPDNAINILTGGNPPPPILEDAVMINHIRNRGYPGISRGFDHISFLIDQQNRTFQRVWRIEHLAPVYQHIYEVSDRFRYRFYFPFFMMDPEAGEVSHPVYFSIEAL